MIGGEIEYDGLLCKAKVNIKRVKARNYNFP
jgi:hypothetical protein